MNDLRRLLVAMLAVGAISACTDQTAPNEVVIDLVSGFPMAEVWTGTTAIDLGSPLGRRHLVSGWSSNRWDKNRKLTYLLADDVGATLEFVVLDPRPLTIRLLGRPRNPDEVDGDQIEVRVNGNPTTDLSVQPQTKRYRIRLPEGQLLAGTNQLTLTYRRATTDGEVVETAQSMLWFELEIEYPADQEPPAAVQISDEESVLIPWGTRLEYYLRLPREPRIVFDRVRFTGNSAGALTVELEQDNRPAELVGTFDAPAESVEFPIKTPPDSIVRLVLAASRRDVATSSQAGVIVTGATLRGLQEMDSTQVVETPFPIDDRNVLLYVVDTLRADHLGLYGYDRPVSPNLDRFAADSTVFDNAIAQSSWTRSSMASVFTGMWPIKHDTNGRKDKLAEEALTLAEVLNEAGLTTTAIARNWNIFPTFGFAQGFDQFRALKRGNSVQVNESVEAWLQNRESSGPFFLYLHTVDPHGPYRPPEEFKKKFQTDDVEPLDIDKHPGHKRTQSMTEEEKRQVVDHLINLYDGEIAANDSTFGLLLELLAEHDLLGNTLIVVVSDHGEEFLEHGTWEHGKNLFAENLNVPLIIRAPEGGHGVRVDQVVQHIDIMPTVLDWLGLPIPAGVEGRSLLPLILPDEGDSSMMTDRAAFSYLELDGLPTQSVVDGDWKFIERVRGDEVIWSGLFHRGEDPGDAQNRLDEHPIRSRYMSLMLAGRIREGSVLTTSEAVLDTETENALKALGYLD